MLKASKTFVCAGRREPIPSEAGWPRRQDVLNAIEGISEHLGCGAIGRRSWWKPMIAVRIAIPVGAGIVSAMPAPTWVRLLHVALRGSKVLPPYGFGSRPGPYGGCTAPGDRTSAKPPSSGCSRVCRQERCCRAMPRSRPAGLRIRGSCGIQSCCASRRRGSRALDP